MKKIMILLAVLLLLAGCSGNTKKPDNDFSELYGVNGDSVVFLADRDDIMDKLQNGTHVVLFAHPDDDQKKIVKDLVELTKQYAGVRIYYYDLNDVSEKLGNDIHQLLTPHISSWYFDGSEPVIYMIRNGELVQGFWSYSEKSSDGWKEAMDIMTKDTKPACSGGC